MRLTATQQRNAVSEGMAFGLIMSGRESLRADKLRGDLAFAGSWRAWKYKDRFPQVGTDLSKGLGGIRAVTRATESKHVTVLNWESNGPEYLIRSRQPDWDPRDAEDVEYALGVIDGDVPLEGWLALAQGFLERFDR